MMTNTMLRSIWGIGSNDFPESGTIMLVLLQASTRFAAQDFWV